MPMLIPFPEHQFRPRMPSLIATITVDPPAEDREQHLSSQQRADEQLKLMIEYLTDKSLPDDEKTAREIVLSSPQHMLIEGIHTLLFE